MELTYGELKERAAAIAAALADARSARNLLSRRKVEEERDECQAERARRRQKRKNERELEELLRRRVRVRVPVEERPQVGRVTARNLYHRAAGMLLGVTGLTDSRGPDGLYSIHFAFTARGFASIKGRRWRRGEAERAARYIVREGGLERGELGWWSNIAADRNELVAFYRAVEALERHDRSNANVYISEVIALPAELSARQRRRAVRRICGFFEKRGLPYAVAIHLPDLAGDQRNYHCHIIYSLRPCEHVAAYEWTFGVAKEADINTPDGILARRIAAVQAINRTLAAAGVAKRYTHLSNKARRMAAAQPKLGQHRTWAARRLAALEAQAATLRRVETGLQELIGQLGQAASRLQEVREVARQGLATIDAGLTKGVRLAGQLSPHRIKARASLAAAGQQLGSIQKHAIMRLAGVQSTARDRLLRQAAVVATSSDGSRVQHARAIAAAQLSKAMTAVVGSHMAQHPRLRQAGAGAHRWLHRSVGEVVARGHASAVRLPGIGSRASRVRMLEIRQSALASTLERLGRRAEAGRAHALTTVLKLSEDITVRASLIGEGQVKLAGTGAVARFREEARKCRLLVQAIDARLSSHKVLFGRIRNTAAGTAARMGGTIGSRLEGSRVRLAAAGHAQGFVRWQALGQMLSALDQVRRAAPDRLHAARERAQIRMTSTINQMRWTIRGAQAALCDVAHQVVRAHRLDLLTGRSRTVKIILARSRDRVATIRQTAAEVLAERLASHNDSLTVGGTRLGQARATMERLAKAAANKPAPVSRAQETKSAEKFVSGAEVAAAPTADPGRRPTSKPSATKTSVSNTEALRKVLPTRTPETDLHGPVLPGQRSPVPHKKPSAVAAMWQRLRGEAEHRAPDIHAELRRQALRRLAASRASINRGEDGRFMADERGLFAEERVALRRPADHDLVQAGLAKLWQAQERRRQEGAATAAAASVTAASPTAPQEEGVSPEVQMQFLAKVTGRGK